MRALIYLKLHLLKNGILSVLTNPKRLVFAVIFVVWMGANILAAITARLTGGAAGVGAHGLTVPEVHLRLGMVALLLMLTATAIERGLDGAVFSFSAADYDLVFPSPIPRRLVVIGRVMADALSLLLWVGIFLLMMLAFLPLRWEGMAGTPAGIGATWLVGWAYAVLVVNGARIVELVVAGSQAAVGSAVRHLKTTAYAVVILAAVGAVWAISRGAGQSGAVLDVLGRPPLLVLFWPMLSVAALLTQETPPLMASFSLTYGLLGALSAAAVVGVCLLDRDIIEVTIEHSARVSRIRQAMRSQNADALALERMQGRPANQRSLLPNWGGPFWALPYRTLAETSRAGTLRVVGWGFAVVIPGLLATWLPLDDDVLRVLVGPVAGYTLFLLASFHALRFRAELGHIALLRALPVPDWQVLAGLSLPRPLAHSVGVVAALIGIGIARPGVAPDMLLAVAMCVPLAACTSSLVGAIAACLFPEATDAAQRFFGGLIHVAGMTIAFAPAIALVVVGTILQYPGPIVGIMGNLGLIPVVVVTWLVAHHLFRKFQPGDE